MIANRMFSRHLAALSATFTIAAAVTLTAAPSTARAETVNPIVVSDGQVDCPPCRVLKVNDQNGLSFRDVTAEVQGNQIVITAEVAVAATAGRPRTGSIVFTALMDDGEGAGFMDYTDDACTPSAMSRQAGTQACDVLSRALREAASTAATPPFIPTTVPSTPAEGIIMRDGGVCDPIRHMGC